MQLLKYLSVCPFHFIRCQMEILAENMRIIDGAGDVIRNHNL